MALEDRIEVVSVVEETYALTGRVLSTEVPGAIEPGIRPEIMQQIRSAQIDPLVTDAEMLSLLRSAYFDLVETVVQLRDELLGPNGGSYDSALEQVHLTGSGRAMKVQGWRRALNFVLGGAPGDRPKWIKKALEWADIILGSLGGVPVVGTIADPIRELKESVEAQADDDQSSTQ
jgi:hypothetical protein